MRKRSVLTRLLSLALGLALLLSCAGGALAAGAAEDLTKPDSPWDHYPATDGLSTSALHGYTPSGSWAFAQAPAGTTNFTVMDELYYVSVESYQKWAVTTGVGSSYAPDASVVYWGNSHFFSDGSVMYSGSMPAMIYTAPKSGTISIAAAAKIFVPWWDASEWGGESPNGMRIAVYKSNQYGAVIPVWPVGERWKLLGGSEGADGTEGHEYAFQPYEICIQAGEKLYFVMDCNGSDVDDQIYWSPTVAYVNESYDADNDPALALPEAAALKDAIPFGGSGDNTYDHGNGWRLDAAEGESYDRMNQLGWDADWANGRYFYTESPNTELDGSDAMQIQWENGVISVNASVDSNDQWVCNAVSLYPADGGKDVALSYLAPRDGVLKLRFDYADFWQGEGSNKLKLAVYKNNVQIWPETGAYIVESDAAAWETTVLELEDITSAVRAGDVFHIRASLVENGSDYGLNILPSAEYTSLEYDESLDKEYQFTSKAHYSYKEQFSGTQGQDNWYYLYAPIGENETTKLPAYYSDWAMWYSGDLDSYNVPQIFCGELLPGSMYDAIVAFKAPYTGTLKLYMEDGMWLADSTGAEDAGDGCYYGVQLSSDGIVTDLLPLTYIPNGGSADFQPMLLSVRKNEYIYIRVNRGEANNWHDSLSLSPAIDYAEIDFDDPGIEEGQAEVRKTPTPGSSLKDDVFPATARDYTEAKVHKVTSEELMNLITGSRLDAGTVYEVTDHGCLYFGGISEPTVYDLQNICIRMSPSGRAWEWPTEDADGRFAIFVEGTSAQLTLRNFTLEVSKWDGSDLAPEAAVNTWDCAGLALQNAQITGTAGYAVHTPNGTPLNLSGSRIDGAFENGAVVQEGSEAAVTGSFIRNTASGAAAVEDSGSTGALIMNNILSAGGTAVKLHAGDAVVQSNTVTGSMDLGSGLVNTLAALNRATGAITAESGRNTVILMNEAGSISASGSESLTLVKNTVSGSVTARNVSYLLMQENTVSGAVNTSGSTNTYGDDLFDPAVRSENGVNGELLPKTNVEIFTGMTHKTDVRTENGTQTLKRYLNLSARNNTYAIVPPGLYTADALALADIEGYDVYAYGVDVEFKSYSGNVFTMSGCTDVGVYGMYISHINNANGQATIIEKTGDYVIAQTDPGYLPDLTDETYYPADSRYVEAFRPGETVPFADIEFSDIEYFGDGKHKCTFGSSNSRELEPGGKITLRGSGASVVVLTGCGGIRFEDFSILSGAGFGFQERNGEGGTELYRVAITAKAAPVLPDDFGAGKYAGGLVWTDGEGRLRGPQPLLSTCDATHSTNMRRGPQVVNCLFEKMTDDATNISGEFGCVTGYDAASRQLTYTKGDNYYEGLPAEFRVGDTAVLFTRSGELLATATVEAAESTGYQAYRLTLDRDVTIKSGTLIENLSANGAGFLFDNCLVDTTRARGFLLKAPDGAIRHCTIRNTGMAAILVRPEIDDGWNECGYVQNLEITDNLLENNGFFKNQPKGSPIAIAGDGQSTSDPAYLMHQNILIEGNVVRDRCTDYALYLNSAQNVKVLNNDFGTRKGETPDTASSVRVDGVYDVEISGNAYPADAQQRIVITAQSRKVYGTDVDSLPIGNYAAVSADTVYTENGWQIVLTIENVSDAQQTFDMRFADTTTAGLLADGQKIPSVTLGAGESRQLYFPVRTLPGELSPKQTYAQVDVHVSTDGASGVYNLQVTFNAAIRTDSAEIPWQQAASIGKEGTDRGEQIAADARFAWDENNLYMKVDVADDVQFDCLNKDELWDWDSIQIGFAPDRTDNSRYFVFTIGQYNGKVRMFMDNDTIGSREGKLMSTNLLPATITRDEQTQTTTYELTISWSKFFGFSQAPAGKTIGFDIVVNDRDEAITEGKEPGQWSRYFIEYYGGIASGRHPEKFGSLILLDGAAALPDADVSALNEALAEAKAIDTSLYTEQSVKALEEAIGAAEALLAQTPTADRQSEVDDAVEALREAMAALQKRQDDPVVPAPKPVRPVTGSGAAAKGDTPFRDVGRNDWYYDAVVYAYENGLMSGTSLTAFSPDAATTRGMIVTILWRQAGKPIVNYAMRFEDVAAGSYYEEAIRWAASIGVVNGYSETAFGPADPITREQMAAILYRYAEYQGKDMTATASLDAFSDAADVSGYAVEAMRWACGEKLINGSGGKLDPTGMATRAQAAAILQRYCENVK